MQLKHLVVGVAALTFASAAPALAGQRGPHPTPAPAAAAHAANAPKTTSPTPHPAPVTVPAKIVANPALAARLQPLLPSGMTLASAAAGFKNQGQFIAALHVSHNLNIPFTQLKTEMTGTDHDSLGQAIHELKPTADSKTAVKTADQQTTNDINTTKPAKPIKSAKTGTDADKDTH